MVREVHISDLPRLLELGKKYYKELSMPYALDLEYLSNIGKFCIESDSYIGLVIVNEDGVIVGFIWGMLVPQMWSQDLSLNDVVTYILPEYRDQRLSRELFKRYEEWGIERGATTVQLSTITRKRMDDAVSLYEELGYTLTGYITTKEVHGVRGRKHGTSTGVTGESS